MAGLGHFVLSVVLFSLFGGCYSTSAYLGKFLGKLSELHHGVSGEVYAVDGRTLHIKDFTYDGQGPAAYFYASAYQKADKNGFRLRDDTGSGEVIRKYRKEGITLTLPDGKTLNDIKIFYVWCEDFDVNFGDVKIPRNFDFPRPQKLEGLKGVHGVSSDPIVVVDAQTILIPNLSYDGQAPDAKFWVGRGSKPSPQGIRVPDENGKEQPLRKYDRKTVVLTLPGDLTIFDIGHFGIWCEEFTVDFGHILVPQGLSVPPSLKMLGVSPQSKLNCEVLFDDLAFEVRWAVAGESIVLQLVAKLDDREYMSFGVSGDDSQSVMVGGDVVVAWVDKQTLKGYAEDYYLKDKSQCSGPTGSCPDNRLSDNTNNIRLLNAAMVNGYSIVTYQRPLRAADAYDRPIRTNGSQAVIWAVGPLNQRDEVSFHSSYLKKDVLFDFGRPARWNCPMPEGEQPSMSLIQATTRQPVEEVAPEEEPVTSVPKRSNSRRRGSNGNRVNTRPQAQEPVSQETENRNQQHRRGPQRGESSSSKESLTPVRRAPESQKKRDAWEIPPIQCDEPEDGVFYAQMGPTGGKRGYPAITGHVGWGISWYINGLLIPEIHVVRGKTYTFVVEGGVDPEVSAKYHPFYITDDPVGGYGYKTPEERSAIRIFAGAQQGKDGNVIPTGVGRLCHWTQTGDSDADDFQSFGAYQRTLELKCDEGEPGVIQWTPDANTPDTVYYQCFTHRHLGWKIHVHDDCDARAAASEPKPSVVAAPDGFQEKADLDLEESPSLQVETRVKHNDLIKDDKEDKESKYTVSETKINPSTNDPYAGQPQERSPSEPIPFQPQQSTFDPLDNRPRRTMHHQFNYQLQRNPYYFRPSMPINVTHDSTSIVELIDPPLRPSSSTTTTTSTTTTIVPPLNIQSMKKYNDNIAIATNITGETYILPPISSIPMTFNENIVFPRSPIYPKRPIVPFMTKMRQMPMRQKFPVKKQIPRPPMKVFRPYMFEFERNKILPSPTYARPQILVSPLPSMIPRPQPIQTMPEITRLRPGQVFNVDISPQQPSTEREPEIQTAPSTTILDITPTFIRPAYNTGFKPGSIKIESGFKPIISKEFQDRVDKEEPEIEYESETGVVNVDNGENYEYKHLQIFEPMFVPSPTVKPVKEKRMKVHKRPLSKKRQHYTKIVWKHPRSLNYSFDEPIAEANERVDTYYLPPENQRQKPVDIVQQPSNIDIESSARSNLDSPPDVVVTYDGKRVSGQSLTAKLNDRAPVLDQRLSKASSLIRAGPQFVKFKGELPPLNPEFINKNAPQLQTRTGALSRSLDTPSAPSGSTRLSRVRNRREAHHTPEHTAQQEEERRNSTRNSGSGRFSSLKSPIGIALVAFFYKYLCFN